MGPGGLSSDGLGFRFWGLGSESRVYGRSLTFG